ncbi:MAG: (2Fe-2S)-binding protein [Pseudomonadota bacterium]
MIICICRRINETAVREAVRAGAACPESVQAHNGTTFNCGKCRTTLAKIIEGEKKAERLEPALVPAGSF